MVESYERRLPVVIFGDGYFARLAHEGSLREDLGGVMKKSLLIVPTEELKEVAKIRDDEYVLTPEGYKGLWVEYPKDWIKWRNTSPRDSVVGVMSTMRGERTERMMENLALLEQIRVMEEVMQQLRNTIAWLTEQVRNYGAGYLELVRQRREIEEHMIGQSSNEPEELPGGV